MATDVAMHTVWICLACDDLFDRELWHCPVCAHHWAMTSRHCRNCHTTIGRPMRGFKTRPWKTLTSGGLSDVLRARSNRWARLEAR